MDFPLLDFTRNPISQEPPVSPRDEEKANCSSSPDKVIFGVLSSNLPATFNSSASAFWMYASKLILSGGAIGPAARQLLSKLAGPLNDATLMFPASTDFSATLLSAEML